VRRTRWLARIGQSVAGLAVGLALAEAAFHVRAHGAFPHLNVYVSDARLGVRLRPGATQRLAFGGNPVTSIVRAWSPMTPLLRQVKAACDAHGARLLVVVLPMDVQVSPAEWAKYGVAEPLDMTPARILVDDLVASAEAIGAAALDATAALAAAEPGAFLRGDLTPARRATPTRTAGPWRRWPGRWSGG